MRSQCRGAQGDTRHEPTDRQKYSRKTSIYPAHIVNPLSHRSVLALDGRRELMGPMGSCML